MKDTVTALEPEAVSIPAAVKFTGIGRSKLYELIQAGRLRLRKVDNRSLLLVADLRALVRGEGQHDAAP